MGGYTVLLAGAAFARQAWNVALPLIEGETFDLIIRRPGLPWETVQVKTASYASKGLKHPSFRPRRRRGPRLVSYQKGDFDFIAAVEPDSGRIWLLPIDCLDLNASMFSLRGLELLEVTGQTFELPDLGVIRELQGELKSRNPKATLTDDQVSQIFALRKEKLYIPEIAKAVGASKSTTARILRGESYRWCERPDVMP